MARTGRPLKRSRKEVAEALRKAGGFKSRAAKMLGISYNALERHLKRYPALVRLLKEVDEQYKDMAEFSLLKQVKKENTQATMYYLNAKAKDRGYGLDRPGAQGSQQFNQFNIALPGGGTWAELMERAHRDLVTQGKPTTIDLAPPVALVTDGAENSSPK